MEKDIKNYAKIYKTIMKRKGYPDVKEKTEAYKNKLREMYSSDAYKEHNVYPTMNVSKVYAVIAMCLMLKEYGLPNDEILTLLHYAFRKAEKFFNFLSGIINVLPNSYKIAKMEYIRPRKANCG